METSTIIKVIWFIVVIGAILLIWIPTYKRKPLKIITPHQMREKTASIVEVLKIISKGLKDQQKGLGSYVVIYKSSISNEICEEITKYYKEAGWSDVQIIRSSKSMNDLGNHITRITLIK